MGYGSYTAGDWAKLKASRGLGQSTSAAQTFRKDTFDDKYNAVYVNMRESFDSEDSPQSTPIILGFDVTGSMGYLAQEIATNALNETIMQILAKKPVTDPHMMCAAFSDPGSPLQVTQFEADIRVVEQLLDFKLGGGNWVAYDTILWYFAGTHTKIDSVEKRGKKGVLIGIGDEVVGKAKNTLTIDQIKKLFGDTVPADYTYDALLALAREKYEVVHIVVGGARRFGPGNALEGWRQALPGRVAGLKDTDIGCLAELIVAILQLLNGENREEILAQIPDEKRGIIREALRYFGKDSQQTVTAAEETPKADLKMTPKQAGTVPKPTGTVPKPTGTVSTGSKKDTGSSGSIEGSRLWEVLHGLFGHRK